MPHTLLGRRLLVCPATWWQFLVAEVELCQGSEAYVRVGSWAVVDPSQSPDGMGVGMGQPALLSAPP